MEEARFWIIGTREHARGRIFEVRAGGKSAILLFTFHALERCSRWGLQVRKVLRACFFQRKCCWDIAAASSPTGVTEITW